MAIITTIDGIPLFTSTQEALNWAVENNCSGYHVHSYLKLKGYMGCSNHRQASSEPSSSSAQILPQLNTMIVNPIIPTVPNNPMIPTVPNNPVVPASPVAPASSSSSSSSYSGGGGY